jgi:hypothetical protein
MVRWWVPGFFSLWRIFVTWRQNKKKKLANPTKGFLRIFEKYSPYLEGKKKKKKLKVARLDLDRMFH